MRFALCLKVFRRWDGGGSQQGVGRHADLLAQFLWKDTGNSVSQKVSVSYGELHRERERERLFQWNDDSLVVLNTVSSQKSNTMKNVSYVKMTGSRAKWHNFVAYQHLCVFLHDFAKIATSWQSGNSSSVLWTTRKKHENSFLEDFFSIYY